MPLTPGLFVERDREPHIWRVAPNPQLYSTSFLDALGSWLTTQPPPIHLSLHLERTQLDDSHADSLCQFLMARRDSIQLCKLWLFDNALTDASAPHIARILDTFPNLLEIHLSHNRLTAKGACLLFASIPAPPLGAKSMDSTDGRDTTLPPLWLRIEWNQINVHAARTALMHESETRGLLVEPSMRSGPCFNNGGRATAHVCLPYMSSQMEAPSQSSVLLSALEHINHVHHEEKVATIPEPPLPRTLSVPPPPSLAPPPPPLPRTLSTSFFTPAASSPRPPSPTSRVAPLFLFLDTSCLLDMLVSKNDYSHPRSNIRAALSFDLITHLLETDRFGSCLPASERCIFVVTDSVLKQLDGLKNKEQVSLLVRRFFRDILDGACSRHGVLAVLGAGQGERMVVLEKSNTLTRETRHFQSKGSIADAKVVEVALYFQQQMERACQSSGRLVNAEHVLLLSRDAGQIQLAKANGLAALGSTDVNLITLSNQLLNRQGEPLTASRLARVARTAGAWSNVASGSRALAAVVAGVTKRGGMEEALQCLTAIRDVARTGGGEREALAAIEALASDFLDRVVMD